MKEFVPNITPRKGFEKYVRQEFAQPEIPAYIIAAVFQIQFKELMKEIARQEFVNNMNA